MLTPQPPKKRRAGLAGVVRGGRLEHLAGRFQSAPSSFLAALAREEFRMDPQQERRRRMALAAAIVILLLEYYRSSSTRIPRMTFSFVGDKWGFSWYSQRLRVDDDGDVADEFLDQVSSSLSFGLHGQTVHSSFEVKCTTKPALVKRQAIAINGNVHPCMEYHGMLRWV